MRPQHQHRRFPQKAPPARRGREEQHSIYSEPPANTFAIIHNGRLKCNLYKSKLKPFFRSDRKNKKISPHAECDSERQTHILKGWQAPSFTGTVASLE